MITDTDDYLLTFTKESKKEQFVLLKMIPQQHKFYLRL